MDRLRTDGEILGYTVVLRSDVEDRPVRGLMLIEIEGKGTDRVIARLDGIAQVQTIHTTNGRWDLIIELATDTLAELDAILRVIRLIDGVASSETNLYLATRRSRRNRPLPDPIA